MNSVVNLICWGTEVVPKLMLHVTKGKHFMKYCLQPTYKVENFSQFDDFSNQKVSKF